MKSLGVERELIAIVLDHGSAGHLDNPIGVDAASLDPVHQERAVSDDVTGHARERRRQIDRKWLLEAQRAL